jgi:hypothetical protein
MAAGFSNSHFEQRIGDLSNSHGPMREYRRNTDQRKQALERLKWLKVWSAAKPCVPTLSISSARVKFEKSEPSILPFSDALGGRVWG